MSQRVLIVLLALALTVFAPTSALSVDLYLDVYGGIAKTEDRQLRADLPISAETATVVPDYDDSFSGGLRFGLWPVSVPWLGFAYDFSFFRAAADGVDINVYSLSPSLMLRVPMAKSEQFPGGRIYPYIGAGPSFSFIDADVDVRPALSRGISVDGTAGGYQAQAGLVWRLERNLAIFGEYRYTNRRVHIEEDDESLCIFVVLCAVSEEIDTKLETHHFLVGLSYWF